MKSIGLYFLILRDIGSHDMCKALQEFYDDGKAEGRASDIIELLSEVVRKKRNIADIFKR